MVKIWQSWQTILILWLAHSTLSYAERLPKIQIVVDHKHPAIETEVARTQQERELGLMFRRELQDYHGMLFVFPDERLRAVWMKNTLIQLDAVFLDHTGVIVNILPILPPCKTEPCPIYPSETEARYMLELPGGFSQKLDLRIGQRLTLPASVR